MVESQKKILVIDDEEAVRLVVSAQLQRFGYATVLATDGLDGLRRFYTDQPDLVLLDIVMPEMDGWQVLERLREVSNVPVLLLTGAAQERDKIRGLREGADDYVTKPFSGQELLARVEAVLRRASIAPEEGKSTTYRDSEVTIDFRRREVVVRGKQIELSPTEFRLFGVLAKSLGQVLSQDQLLDHVWGRAYAESLDVVRVYIGYLRRKIERDPRDPKLIETVRGFGYRYRRPAP
jgi:two-component system KDP operon response regulator KdpE